MKRSRDYLKAVREELKPGVFFATNRGTLAQVLSRELTDNGVELKCRFLGEKQMSERTSTLHFAASRFNRFIARQEWDEAVQEYQTQQRLKNAFKKPAPAHTSDADRIATLESRVARLERALGDLLTEAEKAAAE